MFADRPDASKAAFAVGVRWLARWGAELVDCQVRTAHLERFGARAIPRAEFLERLERALAKPMIRGRWDLSSPIRPPPA
jgi:leucyl/phenylalanyl-tRNA--protein transferase